MIPAISGISQAQRFVVSAVAHPAFRLIDSATNKTRAKPYETKDSLTVPSFSGSAPLFSDAGLVWETKYHSFNNSDFTTFQPTACSTPLDVE
jgi:hypothetical protein